LPRIKLVSAKAGIKGPSEMMGFFVPRGLAGIGMDESCNASSLPE